jgi:hypothetical protein
MESIKSILTRMGYVERPQNEIPPQTLSQIQQTHVQKLSEQNEREKP